MGARRTVKVAVFETAPGAGVWAEETPLALFGLAPGFDDVTDSVTVHELPADTVSPPNVNVPVCPAVNELPLAPVQVPPAIPVVATEMFSNESVNVAFVRFAPLEFWSVNVIRLVPFCAIVEVPKDLVIVAGDTTFSVAVFDAEPAAPVWVVATPEVVLLYEPNTADVTLTVMVQVAEAGNDPAVTLKVVPPATAVVVTPAHEPPTVSGVAFTTFVG